MGKILETRKIEKLSEIPGIGPTVERKLIEHFGSEKEALWAISNADLARITAIPGIGQRLAITIIRKMQEIQEGIRVGDVLRTEDGIEMLDSIINIIRGYTNTEYARNKLTLYFPLGKNRINTIIERHVYFSKSIDLVQKLGKGKIQELSSFLKKLKTIGPMRYWKKITDRIILTNDVEFFRKFKEKGYEMFCSILLVEPEEPLRDYIQSYEFLTFVSKDSYYDSTLDYAENVEIISSDSDFEKIIPEVILWFYSNNYSTIENACDLAAKLAEFRDDATINLFLQRINEDSLAIVRDLIKKLTTDGNIAEGIEDRLDRFRNTVNILDGIIADTEAWANSRISEEITKSSVTIKGEQVLKLLRESKHGPTQVTHYLPDEIEELIIDTIEKAEEKIIEELRLKDEEASWVEGLFTREMTYPVRISDEKQRELEENIRRRKTIEEFLIKKGLADNLFEHIEPIRRSVDTLLEFDLFLSIGRFALDYELSTPNIGSELVGLRFENCKNIFLQKEGLEGKLEVVPISYVVGNISGPEGTNRERVVLLSGANSGGKTCCLQLIAQIIMLAQTGFPIPAKNSNVGLFDEIYYFSKSKGTLDAGAFENALETFSKIISGEKSKIVLVDELESITEPGAAAKIIAGILEMFDQNEKNCAVFVSHLAEEITKFIKGEGVRVDGIEARGLDENLELIVDRNPKFNYLARSMPQLIVERLYRLSKDEKARIYKKFLEYF